MANQLFNDWKRLLRYGDPESETNLKVRAAAFNVVFAISNAFLPDPLTDRINIFLTGCFRITTSHIIKPKEWLITEVGMYKYLGFDGRCEDIYHWWTTDKGDMCFPNNWTTSLDAARIVAEHIANGWLPKVLNALEKQRGRDVAAKLGQELGLYPWNL
jgi:hypothetical protein